MVAANRSVVSLQPINIELKLISELFRHVSKTDNQSNKITLINIFGIIDFITLDQLLSVVAAVGHFDREVLECFLVEQVL
jgi:hypothetical protein